MAESSTSPLSASDDRTTTSGWRSDVSAATLPASDGGVLSMRIARATGTAALPPKAGPSVARKPADR